MSIENDTCNKKIHFLLLSKYHIAFYGYNEKKMNIEQDM